MQQPSLRHPAARTGISLALSSPCGSADAEEEAGMAEEEYRWPP